MHRLRAAFRNFLSRQVVPSLCEDCKVKVRRKFSLRGSIRHVHHKVSHHHRKLRAGIHHVTIRGKRRKVKVLANGRWRFMKS